MRIRLLAMSFAFCLAAPVAAQDARPFTGAHAGPEIGLHEHHFFLVASENGQVTSDRYWRSWDVGGGAFAGYDLAIAPRVRIGVEASISLGGAAPVAAYPDGTRYSQVPRYGFKAVGRAGYVVGDSTLLYGSLGYGGHRYRIRTSFPVEGTSEWGSSFVIGGGIEHRLSERASVRLDFKHLDNQMSQLLVGVPIRF